MADDLVFPRIIYHGLPDSLGLGEHDHPDTGERVGRTMRCESAADFAELQKQGWRLTRDIPDPVAAVDKKKSPKSDDK